MPDEQAGQAQEQQDQQERTYTKEQVEATVKSRVDRQNAKHAAEVEELRRQAEEARKAADDAAKALAEAQAVSERLLAEKARGDAVAAAAREAGVDAELLSMMAGDTPEQIGRNAEVLAAKMAAAPKYPDVVDRGTGGAPKVTREQIEGERDVAKRIGLIAQHPELFE